MELEIAYRPPSELQAFPRNARTHSDEQVAQIAESIKTFGFNDPVAVDEKGELIEGHGRILAAEMIGLDTVPVITLTGLSDAQKRAYRLAHNKIALNAGWDMEMFAGELGELAEDEMFNVESLDNLGFGEELDTFGIGQEEPEGDPEETPELPSEPVSKRGDVWLCGEHRVMCGDATSADDVAKLLGEDKPHLMVTDPPYGVEYDADWRNQAEGIGGWGDPVKARAKGGAARALGKVNNDDRSDWSEAWALFHGEVAYVWHAGRFAAEIQKGLELNGFQIYSQIIWAKEAFVISRGHYHWKHEPCWYAVRKGGTGHWQGARDQSTLWEISHRKSETGHSAQKPVEAMARPMRNNAAKGELVYDPFLGSGTTMIAAEQERRVCLGMEIDPAYVDVCVERWQQYTGKEAVLDE